MRFSKQSWMTWFLATGVITAVVGRTTSVGPAGAAQPERTVVASGLDAPRAIAFGPDDALYVAEAGRGGTQRIDWAPPSGFAQMGTSSRITRVVAGQQSIFASNLQSVAIGPAPEVVGAQGLAFLGSTLYAVVGQRQRPDGGRTRSVLVRVSADGTAQTVADLGQYEEANDPDGTGPDSNPFGLAAGPDGNLYVAEAGANDLLRVTPEGHVSTVAVWPDDPVPTSVTFDHAGKAHVGILSRAPFLQGSARVDQVAVDGTEVVVADPSAVEVPDLTAVVDTTLGPDGALYALEMSSEFILDPPPPHWQPNSGRVLRIGRGGPEIVVEGLNFPTKMALGPDGALYVSNNSVYTPPGSGEVLRFALVRSAAAQVPHARP